MKHKLLLVISLLFLSVGNCFSQFGGENAYSVLTLQQSAKTRALGVDFISSFTDDISAVMTNPATLSPLNHKTFALTYTYLFSGINQAVLAGGYSVKGIGTFALGFQYLNYGNFDMTEENGDVVGKFSAADYVITLSWGKMLDSNVYIGANLKPVFSKYESYSSSAIAIDLSVGFQSNDRTWSASLMARNMGAQIKKFANEDSSTPFDLEFAAAKKLNHAPFILYLELNNLHKWDIREDDPLNPRDKTDLNGNVEKENRFSGFMDNLFRHVQIGTEFVPSKYFYLALGYSWKQNREMQVGDAFSLAGLSYGFGLNYRQFRLAYSRCEYHKYGSPNYVSLLIKL